MSLAEQVVEQLKTDMDNVYDAGYQKGKSEGGDSYYDEFWDSYQDYGNRTAYSYGFTSNGWNDRNFNPKYVIKMTGRSGAQYCFAEGCSISELDVSKIDTSKLEWFDYMFANNSKIKKIIGVLDCTSASSLYWLFRQCTSLEEVSLKKVDTTKSLSGVYLNSIFEGCKNLKKLLFFDSNIDLSLNLKWSSLLEVESVQNIIDCLADLTGQTTQTLTLHADVKAKLTEEQIATITSKNWTLA